MRDTIFVLATSGGGLGHLSRALAVAKELRALNETSEIVFVTSSSFVELIRVEGFKFYYIPGRVETSSSVSDFEWMDMMESLFREITYIHKPKAVIYDAAYPYEAVCKVLRECKIDKTVWIKRECYKDGLEMLNELEEKFGRIITPKEFSTDNTQDTMKKRYVNPIVNVTFDQVYDREWVRKAYGVRQDELLLYIQLGTGILKEIWSGTKEVIEIVQKRTKVRILLGEFVRNQKRGEQPEGVDILREYPASRYFKGIDLAISAAGYNTFHELLACGVPTLFLPNESTVIDDQRKRAMFAQEKKYGLCFSKIQTLEEEINRLFEKRLELKESLESGRWCNGAQEAASFISQYIEE